VGVLEKRKEFLQRKKPTEGENARVMRRDGKVQELFSRKAKLGGGGEVVEVAQGEKGGGTKRGNGGGLEEGNGGRGGRYRKGWVKENERGGGGARRKGGGGKRGSGKEQGGSGQRFGEIHEGGVGGSCLAKGGATKGGGEDEGVGRREG